MQTTTTQPAQTTMQTSQQTGAEILKIENVCRGFDKTQGEVLVLDGVNLTLQEGEIVGLLGRSGSGKSTLLRIICGLIEPSSGSVTYQGAPLRGPQRICRPAFLLLPGLLSVRRPQP